MTIAYYIQSPTLTTTGVLQAKTLNAYEVTLSYEPGYNNTQYAKIKPTGVMYGIKNGKLTKKKTKAKLAAAWPGNDVLDHIGDNYWDNLYSTPDLALASKALSIQKQLQTFSDKLAKTAERIDAYKPIGDNVDVFKQSNPEWFV